MRVEWTCSGRSTGFLGRNGGGRASETLATISDYSWKMVDEQVHTLPSRVSLQETLAFTSHVDAYIGTLKQTFDVYYLSTNLIKSKQRTKT